MPPSQRGRGTSVGPTPLEVLWIRPMTSARPFAKLRSCWHSAAVPGRRFCDMGSVPADEITAMCVLPLGPRAARRTMKRMDTVLSPAESMASSLIVAGTTEAIGARRAA